GPVRLPQDRGGPPHPRLPQARRPVPHRTGPPAAHPRRHTRVRGKSTEPARVAEIALVVSRSPAARCRPAVSIARTTYRSRPGGGANSSSAGPSRLPFLGSDLAGT